MANVLHMRCPHCGVYGAHEVQRTDPKIYWWSEKLRKLFVQRAGRDIAYRRRERECASCDRRFWTVECSERHFRVAMQDWQEWRDEALRERRRADEAEKNYAELQASVSSVADELRELAKAKPSMLDELLAALDKSA